MRQMDLVPDPEPNVCPPGSSGSNETIFPGQRSSPETEGCLVSVTQNGGRYHAVRTRADLGLLTLQIFDPLATAGEKFMTFVVAFLVCCSAAVFLAHAFDAYQAR